MASVALRGKFTFLFLLFFGAIIAQDHVIYIKNGSFEGVPRAGIAGYNGISAPGWIDCGQINFPNETPPDIQPGAFDVSKPAQDGRTYLGLVARINETWESVTQLLEEPMKAGNCYSFDLFLSKSANYKSGQNNNPVSRTEVVPQNKALVLRVYGGVSPCSKKQILAETELVEHLDWRNYEFEFEAKTDLYYFTLEAFYKTPVLLPYRGNLLIDNISQIRQVPCPGEEIVMEPVKPTKDPVVQDIADTKVPPPTPPSTPDPPVTQPKPEPIVKKEKLITKELNSELTAGQTIQINNLYFKADSSAINNSSFRALDEVYDFLKENPNVRIEIGGHTNDMPPHEYCDRLSTDRAKIVATYIIRKGILANRVEFRGYGKRNPIASNKTKAGRKKNQRVEIKILSVD